MTARLIAPEVYIPFAEQGWSNRRIGDHFRVNESTVRRALLGINYQRHLIPEDQPAFEDRFDITLDTPMIYEGDIMITADWHIPLYDPVYVNDMIATARAEGLDVLCIGGDFFNFDALSMFEPKQNSAHLQRELDEAIAVMRVLMETFGTIYFLWGNHDARMHKALGYALKFEEAMRLVFGSLGQEAMSRIRFTNLDHMWIESGTGAPWYVCHPQSYSRIPLSGARAIAPKVNANVITAHSHHCAVGYAVDGQKVVAEIGGLFDKDKTAYLQRSTTFPTWQQGYSYLKNGKLTVCSPGWSLSSGSTS